MIDEIDYKLIVELQKDSRQSLAQLAYSLNINEDTAGRRIENLVSSNTLILTVLPDLKYIGYPIRAGIWVEVESSKLDAISQELCRMPSLGFVSQYVGHPKFYVRGDYSSIESMIKFTRDELGKVNGIVSYETTVEYDRVKSVYINLGISPQLNKSTTQVEHLKIDETDRRLVLQLQKNARTSLKELAQYTGVSQMTVHRRIQELVNAKIIRFTAILNVVKAGYPILCNVHIKTVPAKINDVASSISRYPNVNYVALISGPAQILVGVYAPSVDFISNFINNEINKIDGIVKVELLTFFKVLGQTFAWLPE